MPDYKIGSHVRMSEDGIHRTGTVVGYSPFGAVLVEDDVLLDDKKKKFIWHLRPNDSLTIVPLGDDNA